MRAILSWAEGSPNEPGEGFRVYRSVNGGSFTLFAELPLTVTSIEDTSIEAGNVYVYRICEHYMGFESPYAVACVAILGESGAGMDSGTTRATFTESDLGQGADEGTLTAQPMGTENGTASDFLVAVAADMAALDAGLGQDFIEFCWRDYSLFNLSDSGQSQDFEALASSISSLDAARSEEKLILVAQVDPQDEGLGTEKMIMGVRRYGRPWGLTAVTLEAVQE